MKIKIVSGIGTGPTKLSAFDKALVEAGVANHNLIYLSSVIPPGADIEISGKVDRNTYSNWGDKLYVVMAQQRTAIRNKGAWAGIGWVQDPDSKKGLMVEHEGQSESEVRSDIKASLQALVDNRPEENFDEFNMEVVGGSSDGEPMCALVIACFETESWQN